MADVFTAIFATIIFGLIVAFAIIILWGLICFLRFLNRLYSANLEDIKAAIEKIGGEAHWTMLAEAAQYRETLRMEERIESDIEYRKQWEERQIRLEDLEDSMGDDEGDGE